MEEKRISDLIDLYLLGSLSPMDRAYLEERMAADPAVAQNVRESQNAFAVLLSERNRRIKERLQEIDRKDSSQGNRFIKRFIPFLLFLLGIVGFLFWASQFYAPASIASRYFDSYPMPYTRSNDTAELEKKWEQANQAFIQEEYGLALNLYDSWNQDAGPIMDYSARWNILLTQFALHGATAAWKRELERFAREAPPALQIPARRLNQFLDSSFYRIFLASIQDHLSAIRPRLI
jgi:hypothetical protein